jgi:carboxypeptidase C (cathepsin A)
MIDAGHMLHHDQPERLAQLIEAFLAAGLSLGGAGRKGVK